ncbi:agmatine deiminase family protein [Alkalimarinus sediminis]|uniref:Agmatine deiminase family protein n=1 Tax=Alkalimarinus sediminis TaxID=1632866 RepID=A0A9E8HND6_9ALTE|nr:agmatine deiminase family protein [Alkalimarinus sediminis]UZW76126.1 agmatine deiminase family protein [Alkalimarinus sediminis]
MNNPDILFPSEWSHQYAILLTWPHKSTDWVFILEEVETLYLQLAKEILKRESLIIACADESKIEPIRSALEGFTQYSLEVKHIPSDDTWARDHGPITVYKNGSAELLDFSFNAWGGKFAFDQDNLINKRLKESGVFPQYTFKSINMVMEGGALESNGQGVLLTTSDCLLNPNRNPELSKQEIEKKLSEALGIKQVLWLDNGYLAGDDTDSHIDTLARFCSEDLICYVKCGDQSDEHYDALKKMEQQLKAFTQPNGEPYRLEPLPMTEAIFEDGERLPATYANFLIINNAVLAPVYGVEQDQTALETLQRCFPQHEIVAINCRPLIKQHGSLHCITMQIPSPSLDNIE